MKKKSVFLLTGLLMLSLSSCQVGSTSSSKLSSSENKQSSTSTSSKNEVSSSVSSSSSISSSSIVESSTTSSSSSIEYELKTKVFDSSNYTDIGSYLTGNYDSIYCGGTYFTHYRAVEPKNYGDMMTLLPYVSNKNDTSIAGMLYNTTAIIGIKEFSISYATANSSGDSAILRYGNDISVDQYVELEPSTSTTTKTFRVRNANYFKVETNNYKLHIESITLKYTGIGDADTYTYLKSGDDDFRINPVVFSGSKVSGESSVNVPVSVIRNGDAYIVDEYKTYTYYSYSDVSSNPSLADYASYTTPEDVAAYFVAFGEAPANYVAKKQYSNAYNIFGSDTRCVSNYKRTDGYAKFVPWAKAPGQTYPIYYECDIDLDGTYSKSSRGVGRVVVWLYGFDHEGYDNAPVAVYTDDHYATFQEYLNTGKYGTRFNAELSPTNYVWGTPAILTI